MSQDFIHPNQRSGSDDWTLAKIIERAADSRRLFPYGGFRGVKTAEIQVLLVVLMRKDATLESIGAALCLDQSSVSQAMSSLESMGLLRKAPDPIDRRRRSFRATRKGRMLGQEYLQSV